MRGLSATLTDMFVEQIMYETSESKHHKQSTDMCTIYISLKGIAAPRPTCSRRMECFMPHYYGVTLYLQTNSNNEKKIVQVLPSRKMLEDRASQTGAPIRSQAGRAESSCWDDNDLVRVESGIWRCSGMTEVDEEDQNSEEAARVVS